MNNNEKYFTLDDISASWLGHGKKIPIGESMAWLIKEVERLHNQLANAGEVERTLMEQIARHKQDEADECLECLRTELEHKIAEIASKCGVPHTNDFDAFETLNRISSWYLEERDCRNNLEIICDQLLRALEDALGHLCLPGEKPLKGVEDCVETARSLIATVKNLG